MVEKRQVERYYAKNQYGEEMEFSDFGEAQRYENVAKVANVTKDWYFHNMAQSDLIDMLFENRVTLVKLLAPMVDPRELS